MSESPTVSVVIPWRAQASRVAAFEHVHAFYRELLPDAEIVLADSRPDRPFNLAEARNQGALAAHGNTLLIVDADSLAEPDVIRAAIAQARDGLMHYCFDRFAYLDADQSAAVYAGDWPDVPGGPHESSVMAIAKDAYWRAGGSDERFRTWGGEDNVLRAACDTILGGSWWHPGLGFTLHHETTSRQASAENLRLVARYRAAWKRPARMRPILAEPGRHASLKVAA